MGLYKGDLEKVPENFSIKDCYERIYRWHMSDGLDRILKGRKVDRDYFASYAMLRFRLPPPGSVSQEDMDFIFREVLMGLMEWSYHEEDEFGIKMAAYAEFAINRKYGNWQNQEFKKSYKAPKLFAEFYPSKK